MPAWNELLAELDAQADPEQGNKWLQERQRGALRDVSQRRNGRHVIFYASAFLQKPTAAAHVIQITFEDINAFMSVMYGMDWTRGLTLILHTPGGVTNATETIVSYLRSKFTDIEVIIPTFAMSAGTMISLASDRIVMGRQSQLGPIDPQFIMGSTAISARAIVDQFDQARSEILADTAAAHLWAPVLQTVGPALLQEATNALVYGERMVRKWLAEYMFGKSKDRAVKARRAAKYFNDAGKHKSHGRRIDRDEARKQRLVIEDLETDQDLQEAVLTAYHLATIVFERGPAAKLLTTDSGRSYVKNWNTLAGGRPRQL